VKSRATKQIEKPNPQPTTLTTPKQIPKASGLSVEAQGSQHIKYMSASNSHMGGQSSAGRRRENPIEGGAHSRTRVDSQALEGGEETCSKAVHIVVQGKHK
jgi:hypothetical protein